MTIRRKAFIIISSLSALLVLPTILSYFELKEDITIFDAFSRTTEVNNTKSMTIVSNLLAYRAELDKIGQFRIKQKDPLEKAPSDNNFMLIDSHIRASVAYYTQQPAPYKDFADSLQVFSQSYAQIYHNLHASMNVTDKAFIFDELEKSYALENTMKSLVDNIIQYDNSLITAEREKNNSASYQSIYILLASTLIGLCFLFFAFYSLFHYILMPLKDMSEATKKIGNGDYQFRLNIQRTDEIGELSQSFDKMLDNLDHAKLLETQKQELEALNEQLKVKNDSLDSFVYRVSHDLKAPLINIISLLSLVKRRTSQEDKSLQKTLGFIDSSVIKLQTTIYDLLEVSRIERNLKEEKEDIDIDLLVDNIKEELSEQIRLKDVVILTDFREGGTSVYFAKANIKSIFSNLISNAIKYYDPSRQPVIKISTRATDDYLQLKIEDNGMGIDLERHGDKLYNMFSRFHNHVEGSGVGLYIVNKLVKDNGGKIEIESKPSKGTAFTIYFKTNPQLEFAY
jgi:signal transduction histidine kinase